MKLLCTDTCFINKLYNYNQAYEVDEKTAKGLLQYPYFKELDGPPPPREEEPQEPGRRKKITVK